MKTFFILILFIFMTSQNLRAQDEVLDVESSPARIVQDRSLIEKARSHDFKGGAEEGELRVQAQLPKSQRKIIPAVDLNEMEKEHQDHD